MNITELECRVAALANERDILSRENDILKQKLEEAEQTRKVLAEYFKKVINLSSQIITLKEENDELKKKLEAMEA